MSSEAVSVELLQPAADLAAAKHRTMTTAMSVGLEGLNLTETPSCFSLLPGETLVRAIRAVDTESSGLAAGALVRLPDGFSHDLWLSDLDEAASSTRYRWETASGSKLQTRGAVRVLDALFHEHLQRGGSSIQLTVRLADARTTAVGARGASARAARARGFVQHEVTTAAAEEGGGRRFDSGVGSAAYTTLALKQAQLDSESVFILGQLAKERRRAFFSFNRSFTLDDGRDEGWSGVEATMVRDARGGDGGDPSEDAAATLGADEAVLHGRREGDVVRRLRTPPKLLGGFLSSESRSELAALAHALPFSHEEDSVDLQPSEHCMLFENGALLSVAEPWTDTLLALIGKLEAWARTRDALGDAVVTDAFVRRYASSSSSASVPSSSSRRSEIPAHWDSLAECTFVIELESASEGGVYLQHTSHAAATWTSLAPATSWSTTGRHIMASTCEAANALRSCSGFEMAYPTRPLQTHPLRRRLGCWVRRQPVMPSDSTLSPVSSRGAAARCSTSTSKRPRKATRGRLCASAAAASLGLRRRRTRRWTQRDGGAVQPYRALRSRKGRSPRCTWREGSARPRMRRWRKHSQFWRNSRASDTSIEKPPG